MPHLLVVPEDTFETLQAFGHSLSKLEDVNYMVENISASDLADIHVAHVDFPYELPAELGIGKAPTPLEFLAKAMDDPTTNTDSLQNLYNRVNGLVQTRLLKVADKSVNSVCEYVLHPVNENLWVAVQQRLRHEASDPSRVLLRANESFFDSMIAQALQLFKFEQVCSSNLFTYYLGSLAAKA